MRRPHPLLLLALLLLGPPAGAVPSRNLVLEAWRNDFPVPPVTVTYPYSSCWSYVHPDGREYAVLGTASGTAIYNVTDGSNVRLVGFVPGPNSIYREAKSYRTWIYIVTEGGTSGRGLQIVRMTDPDKPVLAATWTASFVRSHTVEVDTARARLVCSGTWTATGNQAGMRILSLADPEAPVDIGHWPPGSWMPDSNYVHDTLPLGDRYYCSSIGAGHERLVDVSDPANPQEQFHWTWAGARPHNAVLDPSGRYLYVSDETNGEPLKIFDVTDPLTPVLAGAITSNPKAIVHNAHVWGDTLYCSNYTEGIRLHDISDPAHPAEFAWADTWAGPSGGFCGAWEIAKLPSGRVIASDRNSGLYLFRPIADYGLLRVKVVDAATDAPLAGVTVRLVTQGDSLATPADGIVQFAPSPGLHRVEAAPFGWTKAAGTRAVTLGSRDTVKLAIARRSTGDLVGTVTDAVDGGPAPGAEVRVAGTPLPIATIDSDGAYRVAAVPTGTYDVEAHAPGYRPQTIRRPVGAPGSVQDYTLQPCFTWDQLEVADGWTVGGPGDDATAGTWIWAEPVGTGDPEGGLAGAGGAPDAVRGPEGATRSPFAGTGGEASATTLRVIRPIGFAGSCGDSAHLAAGMGCARTGAAGAATIEGDDGPPDHCGCGASCTCGVQVVGSVLPGGPFKPWSDRTPGVGTHCFVTGQAPSHDVDPDAWDLDGRTTLTSPRFTLSGMSDPMIGWWRWFISYEHADTDQPDDEDWLAVLLSNDDGVTWVAVDTTRGRHNRWEERSVRVANLLVPGPRMRIRFVVADRGRPSLVEAGVDDVTTYERIGASASVDAGLPARLRLGRPAPNPSTGSVRLAVQLPARVRLDVTVFDVAGRAVRTLHGGEAAAGTHSLEWDGRDSSGQPTSSGLYFVRARAGAEERWQRVVRAR